MKIETAIWLLKNGFITWFEYFEIIKDMEEL